MKIYLHTTIEASLKKIDDSAVLLTDYAGDIVNLLVNKPKGYRIVYIPYDDVYLIADAKDYIHEYITQAALDEGWLPKLDEFMRKNHEDIEDIDAYRTVNLVFLTEDNLEKFGTYSDPYNSMEFGYEFPITTGSVFTKSRYSKNYLKQSVPELYSKLQRYAVDSNRVMDEYLWS